MVKRNIHTTIEADVLLKIDKITDNRSALIERLLSHYLSHEYTQETDLLIVEKKLALAEKELSKHSVLKEKLSQQLETIKKVKEEEDIEKMEEAKRIEEEAKKCKLCGEMISEGVKVASFPAGNVHMSCFLSSDRVTLEKLSKEPEEVGEDG